MKPSRLPVVLARAVLRLPYLAILGLLDTLIALLEWVNRRLDGKGSTIPTLPSTALPSGRRHLLTNEPIVAAMREPRLQTRRTGDAPDAELEAVLHYGDDGSGEVLLQAHGTPAQVERALLAALAPDAADALHLDGGQLAGARYVRHGACLHVLPDGERAGRGLLVNVATLEQLRGAVQKGLADNDALAPPASAPAPSPRPMAATATADVPTVPRFAVRVDVAVDVPLGEQALVDSLLAAGALRRGWSDSHVDIELGPLAPGLLLQVYRSPLQEAIFRLSLRLGEHLVGSATGDFERAAAGLLVRAKRPDGHAQPAQERGVFAGGSYACNGVILDIDADDDGSPALLIHAIARDSLRAALEVELERLRAGLTPL
ncbi:hypothetical protein [Herbaspirillum robiniae]|uniref:Uncharacterized protein n=1 Tax=Herbaspirillum robiniae TaxID=2014887 RepID=A0ABX2LV30_9BURK|nr:hypothetical protein [Herbaspirillum robiniae]NUU01598.1 hypothetical protein [Herbaspirillum robiniae]